MAHGSLSRHFSDTQPDMKKLRFNGTPDTHQTPAVATTFSSSFSRPYPSSCTISWHTGSKEVVGTLSRQLTMVDDVTLSSDGMSGRRIGDTTAVHQVVAKKRNRRVRRKGSGTEKDKDKEAVRHAEDNRVHNEALASEQGSTGCTAVKSSKSRGCSCWRCERWNKLPRASSVVVLEKEGSCLSPGASRTERVVSHEQACRSQFCWRSKDSGA